jgi:hypothetical protein
MLSSQPVYKGNKRKLIDEEAKKPKKIKKTHVDALTRAMKFQQETDIELANSRNLLMSDLILPNGTTIKSLLQGERTNIWITGDTGTGKHSWIFQQMNINGKRLFYRGGHPKYPYDGYDGERLVLISHATATLKPKEIMTTSNKGYGIQMPLKTRYKVTLANPFGWSLIVITDRGYVPLHWMSHRWFTDRFLVLDWMNDCVACTAISNNDCIYKEGCKVCIESNDPKYEWKKNERRIASCKCKCRCNFYIDG